GERLEHGLDRAADAPRGQRGAGGVERDGPGGLLDGARLVLLLVDEAEGRVLQHPPAGEVLDGGGEQPHPARVELAFLAGQVAVGAEEPQHELALPVGDGDVEHRGAGLAGGAQGGARDPRVDRDVVPHRQVGEVGEPARVPVPPRVVAHEVPAGLEPELGQRLGGAVPDEAGERGVERAYRTTAAASTVRVSVTSVLPVWSIASRLAVATDTTP